jgi:hypothetical protein
MYNNRYGGKIKECERRGHRYEHDVLLLLNGSYCTKRFDMTLWWVRLSVDILDGMSGPGLFSATCGAR